MQVSRKFFFYIYVASALGLKLAAAYLDFRPLAGQLSQGSLDALSGKASFVFSTGSLMASLELRFSPQGQPLQLESASPSHSLSFSSHQNKGRWQISFLGANPEAASATVEVDLFQGDWAEHNLALPLELRQFEAIVFRPLALEGGLAQLKLAALRLDPPAYSLDARQTALLMGVSLDIAREIQSFNLDELLAWDLMRIAAHGLAPQEILRLRASKSWGEIAQAAGSSWAQICEEVGQMALQTGYQPAAPRGSQAWRSLSNSIGREARP